MDSPETHTTRANAKSVMPKTEKKEDIKPNTKEK